MSKRNKVSEIPTRIDSAFTVRVPPPRSRSKNTRAETRLAKMNINIAMMRSLMVTVPSRFGEGSDYTERRRIAPPVIRTLAWT